MSQPTELKEAISLPESFKSSFVMDTLFATALKQKAFICWKILNSLQIKLSNINGNNQNVVCMKKQIILQFLLFVFFSTNCKQFIDEKILRDAANELEELMIVGWEKIHCGKWDEIDLIWRDLYSFACFGNAGILFLNDDLKKCIHTLDLGIMLGHKTYQQSLQTFIQYAHNKLIKHKNNELNSSSFPILRFTNDENDNQEMKNNEDYMQCIKYLDCKVDLPLIDKNNLIKTVNADNIDLIQFITNHFNQSEPVLIKKMVSNWPAIEKWKNLNYFIQKAGFRSIPVEIGKVYTDDNWTQKVMSFHQFILNYLLSDNDNDNDNDTGYLAQHLLFKQIKCFNSDFDLPDFVHVGKKDFDSNGDINCWFGPKGTITPIHYDPKHNILTQVIGYKYLRIYSPKESQNLYPRDGILYNTSLVDLEMDKEIINKQFPKFLDTKYFDIMLEPGDALYIPPKWWHYVKSLSISFSISFWFE